MSRKTRPWLAHREALRLHTCCVLLLVVGACHAPTRPGAVPDRLEAIDRTHWTAVRDTAHPQARPEADLGPVDPALPLTALSLNLAMSASQQQDLDELLADQQNAASPHYRQWLTPQEFGRRFGPSDHDLDATIGWLQTEGFTILRTSNSRTRIFFTGTAGQVEQVFHAPIHSFLVDGETHFLNATAVSVPSALVELVQSVGGLDDLRPRPSSVAHQGTGSPTPGDTIYTFSEGVQHYMSPEDYAKIYDIQALYNLGVTGTGQSLAIVGQTDFTLADVQDFDTAAGLSPIKLTSYLVPNSGSATYVSSNDYSEAQLDIEWSSAVARNASINYVYTGGNGGWNVWNSIEYAADNPGSVGNPTVISASYLWCETYAGRSFAISLENYVKQANAEGITVIACSGDSGAAGCDSHGNTSITQASDGLAVEIPASFPEVTAAGGTEFAEGSGTYWSGSDDGAGGSVLSYVPETSWNDPTGVDGLAASGGGASTLFSKPSWQVGTGVPNDGARDIPDISMAASWEHDGYLLCLNTGGTQYCAPGHGFFSTNSGYYYAGGTSAAAPTFAGLVTLLVQSMGKGGLGNINSTLYGLAGTANASSVFHDITTGNNIIPCQSGTANCGCPSGTPGCSAAAPNQFGYSAGVGYDQVTGLGSVDGYNLWKYWPTTTTTTLSTANATIAVGDTASIVATVATTRIGPGFGGDTVTFFAGGKSIGVTSVTAGTGATSSGSATLATSTLPLGTNTITASFAGDATYQASSASALTITVNPALAISPLSKTVVPGNTVSLVSSGGVGSNTWSIATPVHGTLAAGCSNQTSCVYTASTGGATDTITVTDALGNKASAVVTIDPPLTLTPASLTLAAGDTYTYTFGGGVAPFIWSISPNDGSATISTAGVLVMTATALGTYSVSLADSDANQVTSTVTCNPALALSPLIVTVPSGAGLTYAVSGGVPPYAWATAPANGTVNVSSSGALQATAAALGAYSVALTDAFGNHLTAAVTVVPALAVSPTSPLAAAPRQTLSLSTGGTGAGPFTWSLGAGGSGGRLSATTGPGINYTAGVTGTVQDTITVSDSIGENILVTVAVDPQLSMTPAALTLAAGGAGSFTAQGGYAIGGYVWSVVTGTAGGSFTGSAYTAPTPGTDTIQVADSFGNTATGTVTVVQPLLLTPSSPLSVAPRQVVNCSTGTSGAAPLTWTLQPRSTAQLSGTSGDSITYTAGAGGNTQDTVTVTDAIGETRTLVLNVGAPLTISPQKSTIVASTDETFTAAGGYSAGGYTWSIVTPGQSFGTVSAGVYTAGAATGTDTVQVQDMFANTALAKITIALPLQTTPSGAIAVAPRQTVAFSAGSTGAAPISWSLSAGGSGAKLSAASGASTTYTAGPTPETKDTLIVTDAIQQSVTETLTVGPGVTILPGSFTLLPGATQVFSATGGLASGGYLWSIISSRRVGMLSGGTYTAGPQPGSDTIQATDSLGNSATATVTVAPPLVVTPASPVTAFPMQPIPFATNGTGIPPFVWSLQTNGSGGTLSSSLGSGTAYSAGPLGNSIDLLTVTDSAAESQSIVINIGAGITIAPSMPTVLVNGTLTFMATGGDAATGYTWSVATTPTPLGSFTGNVYSAGALAGTEVIQVTDGLGNVATTNASLVLPLSISPVSPLTVPPRQSVTLTAANGAPPYMWTIVSSGDSSLSGSGASATYVAGPTSGAMDTATVTDALGETASTAITVGAAVTISPMTPTVVAGHSQTFTASGGAGSPFTWSIATNLSGGSFQGAVYTAGPTPGTDGVAVRDSLGNAATTSVVVVAGLTVTPAQPAAVPPRSSIAFRPFGGEGPFTWTLTTNGSTGTIDATGHYTAGSVGSVSDIVSVADALGERVTVTVQVGPDVSITPANPVVRPGGTLPFQAAGGNGGAYLWSITGSAPNGLIDSRTGVYTGGLTTGVSDTVQAADSLGNMATTTVTVGEPADAGTVDAGMVASPKAAGGCRCGLGGGDWTMGLALVAFVLRSRRRR